MLPLWRRTLHRPQNRERQKEEQLICNIQSKEKVTRIRAKQIIAGCQDNIEKKNTFAKYFKIQMEEQLKRKMNPWILEKCLQNQIDGNLKIRSGGKDNFIVEIQTMDQSKLIVNVTEINQIPVTVTDHNQFNSSKSIVYIYEYYMENFEE